MAREPRKKSQSGVYHIMWRGANRQVIFHDDQDRLRFLDYVDQVRKKMNIQLFAWCLMNNHVHLLLKEGDESLSDTMKWIGVCYVGYYNWKYKTIGPLFQNRFKSESVESIRYLLTVVRYIHQNPIKAGMVKHVKDWEWSSCRGYYGSPIGPEGLLDTHLILTQFSSEDLEIARQLFLEFNEKVNEDQCLDDGEKLRRTDDEAREEMMRRLPKIEITQVKSLPKSQRNDILRQVKKIDGISQRQAARILGISPSLVFKA